MKSFGLWLAFAAGCATLPPHQAALRDDAKGLDDLSSDKPCEALSEFHDALAVEPGAWAPLRHEVLATRRCGGLDRLLESARSRVAHRPEEPLGHYLLGLCLLAGPGGEREGLAELQKARALAPNDPELALRLGIALLESEKWSEAVEPLERAVALAPADPHPRFPLSLALHRTGHDHEALASLAAAVPLLPTDKDLEAGRKLVRLLHDPERVIPLPARPRFEEGMSWLDRHEAGQRAVEVFEALQSDYPQLAPLQAALGLAYQQLGDAAQAVAHFERAAELDPSLPEPHLYLGELYLGLRRHREAAQELRAAIAGDPFLEEARAKLEELAVDAGDVQTAIAQSQALVGLLGGKPMARLLLTRALALAGDLEGAEAQLHAILESDPKNLQAKIDLAAIDVKRSMNAASPEDRHRLTDRARKLLGEVLADQPENAAANQLLATLAKK